MPMNFFIFRFSTKCFGHNLDWSTPNEFSLTFFIFTLSFTIKTQNKLKGKKFFIVAHTSTISYSDSHICNSLVERLNPTFVRFVIYSERLITPNNTFYPLQIWMKNVFITEMNVDMREVEL